MGTLRKFPGPWAERAGYVMYPPPTLLMVRGGGLVIAK